MRWLPLLFHTSSGGALFGGFRSLLPRLFLVLLLRHLAFGLEQLRNLFLNEGLGRLKLRDALLFCGVRAGQTDLLSGI